MRCPGSVHGGEKQQSLDLGSPLALAASGPALSKVKGRQGRARSGRVLGQRGSCALGNLQTFGSAFKNVSNREGRTESLLVCSSLREQQGRSGGDSRRRCARGPHFPCCSHHDPAVRGVGALTYQADSRIPPGTQQRQDRSRWGQSAFPESPPGTQQRRDRSRWGHQLSQ